jgi:hypothetical protein
VFVQVVRALAWLNTCMENAAEADGAAAANAAVPLDADITATRYETPALAGGHAAGSGPAAAAAGRHSSAAHDVAAAATQTPAHQDGGAGAATPLGGPGRGQSVRARLRDALQSAGAALPAETWRATLDGYLSIRESLSRSNGVFSHEGSGLAPGTVEPASPDGNVRDDTGAAQPRAARQALGALSVHARAASTPQEQAAGAHPVHGSPTRLGVVAMQRPGPQRQQRSSAHAPPGGTPGATDRSAASAGLGASGHRAGSAGAEQPAHRADDRPAESPSGRLQHQGDGRHHPADSPRRSPRLRRRSAPRASGADVAEASVGSGLAAAALSGSHAASVLATLHIARRRWHRRRGRESDGGLSDVGDDAGGHLSDDELADDAVSMPVVAPLPGDD